MMTPNTQPRSKTFPNVIAEEPLTEAEAELALEVFQRNIGSLMRHLGNAISPDNKLYALVVVSNGLVQPIVFSQFEEQDTDAIIEYISNLHDSKKEVVTVKMSRDLAQGLLIELEDVPIKSPALTYISNHIEQILKRYDSINI